ncbi:hypothetical protein F4821DRAFT_250384 [Hypoxylon rubiginosum]|uniref:Uncharacterized protein n=1 Tax=Hypoxylon rubiginosum TaxID=110542 RepID=A0ACC0CKS0_9PEZI|nr:hypothetical protein F4821DRAFT_250384 [Hypoxylon rubiginosum]
MSAIIKTTVSLACFAAVALAAPTWTDCDAGEYFYSCANGYRGCFSMDPCALPPVGSTPTTTTSATTSATAIAAVCPTGTASAKIWQPTMYNLYPSEPDRAEAPVSHLEVSHKSATDPAVEQVAVFSGIPASAKSCTLGWAQGAAAERVFKVENSGLVSTLQLTGFPSDVSKVSSASVAAYEPTDAVKAGLTIDFTNWDKVLTAAPHSGGPVDCAETIYVKVGIKTTNGDGYVYMDQDAKNGLTISYTC